MNAHVPSSPAVSSTQPAAIARPLRAREAHGARLTVDLAALASNYRDVAALAPGAECAAVVKADAYGTGLERAAPALAAAGCRTFFVAHLSEALRLRAALPAATIYVLNGMPPGSAVTYAASTLRPVLGSGEEIEEWAAFARAAGGVPPAAVHVDTGMNRLGLPPAEAVARLRDGLAFPVSLLMSHFVSAEVADDPVNGRQVAAFDAVRAAVPGVPASLANSSGVHLAQRPHYDMVRPGFALYGGNATPGRVNAMRPVVSLRAPIVQVREIEDGETVGYNGQWRAKGRRRVAAVSVGYADGWPREAGGTDGREGGLAIVEGVPCPFAGRVSMDLIVLDVTDVPAALAKRGAEAHFLGAALGVDAAGARGGTIGYEILTGLGHRYAREYRDAPAARA